MKKNKKVSSKKIINSGVNINMNRKRIDLALEKQSNDLVFLNRYNIK